jgi:hypothetical protein
LTDPALNEFKEVLADFREIGSLALKGAIAVPLADLWLKLGPPPANAVAVLGSLVEMLAVMWVFQFWYSANDRKLNFRMKTALVLFFVGIVASLILLEEFTIFPSPDRERVIEGVSLRADVKPIIDESYRPEDALKDNQYDPDKVWTKESIVVVRVSLTLTWMFTLACLAAYLTVFIILGRRHSTLPVSTSPK